MLSIQRQMPAGKNRRLAGQPEAFERFAKFCRRIGAGDRPDDQPQFGAVGLLRFAERNPRRRAVEQLRMRRADAGPARATLDRLY
jgi:hypothetical protein